MADKTAIAYAHESHRRHNERFAHGRPKPKDLTGSWLSNDAATNLPQVHREFDLNRDPHIRRQVLDAENTNSRNRDEQSGGASGRGSSMVKADNPAPFPRPSAAISGPVDRRSFQGRWLAEQRDAVLARVSRAEPEPNLRRELSRACKEPSR